ncbi:hypothetical protein EYR41_002381 [Orbilia oligospora]|uniref:Uncharacterized protein n=1 Tax=Orbilia oligospora TaxID=2813651 RepID=A0A7C8P4J3_ORBOL|nr:hypothetical protein TWF751_012062 [Orbilia oligospora]TGJ62401.1 hypothetical protein EYR41_002381 [Orbilia oligospora]
MSSATTNPQETESELSLIALPTEILLSVVSFLHEDYSALKGFARCSRRCYILTFRKRFSGVRLCWKNSADCEYPKPFSDEGILSSFRGYIRTATIEVRDAGHLLGLVSLIKQFPNISKLEVSVENSCYFERTLYLATFRLLGTLPFYDNLKKLELKWGGDYASQYRKGDPKFAYLEAAEYVPNGEIVEYKDESSGFIPLPEPPYKVRNSQKKQYKFRLAQYVQVQRDFLGPYIKETKFLGRLAEIRLPKELKALGLGMQQAKLHLLPLINCTTVDTLILTRAEELEYTTNPVNPTEILQFPAIKKFVLAPSTDKLTPYFRKIAFQFPNVESFKLIRWANPDAGFNDLPNFPKLRHLETFWPMNYEAGDYSTQDVEDCLRFRFRYREWLELRSVKFRGHADKLHPRPPEEHRYGSLICNVERKDGEYLFNWATCK